MSCEPAEFGGTSSTEEISYATINIDPNLPKMTIKTTKSTTTTTITTRRVSEVVKTEPLDSSLVIVPNNKRKHTHEHPDANVHLGSNSAADLISKRCKLDSPPKAPASPSHAGTSATELDSSTPERRGLPVVGQVPIQNVNSLGRNPDTAPGTINEELPISSVGEIKHFLRHVLGDGTRNKKLSARSSKIHASTQFRRCLQRYLVEVEAPESSRRGDHESLLLDIIKIIQNLDAGYDGSEHTPRPPLDIAFVSGKDRSEPGSPARCFGILRSDHEMKAYQPSNVLFVMEVSRRVIDLDGSDVDPDSHGPMYVPPTMDDGNLSKDALRVVSTFGNRRHILGLYVAGKHAYLGCYDAAGALYTKPMGVMDTDFITTILSLNRCTPDLLGFEPSIVPPTSEAGLPARDVHGCRMTIQDRTFVLQEAMHVLQDLHGRKSAIYTAVPDESSSPDDKALPSTVIIKLSWQLPHWTLEDDIYRRAEACNITGVPKLYYSAVLAKLSDPKGKRRFLHPEDFFDRELRVQVLGPVCKPLYTVTDLDQFKAAFISLVQTHHDLYEKAGILHRDISLDNLMVDPSDSTIGILIDFDHSTRVAADDGSPILVKPRVTGTPPFLAMDALRETPPPKPYFRHDLESFLYVLVYILTHHDEQGNEDPSITELDHWEYESYSEISRHKLSFLSRPHRLRYLPRKAKVQLKDTWVPKLARLFRLGYAARNDYFDEMGISEGPMDAEYLQAIERLEWIERLECPPPEESTPDLAKVEPKSGFDFETLDGHVTFQAFMDVLRG